MRRGLDGLDNLAAVAAGQVGAADAAGEERVPGNDHIERVRNEGTPNPGCDRECATPWRDSGRGRRCIPSVRLASGAVTSGVGTPIQAACSSIILSSGQVIFVEEDGRAGEVFELERAADVVDVGVGDEDLLELQAEVRDAAVDAADLVAGVDDDSLGGFFVAEQGAVALQRTDGEGLENHEDILAISEQGSIQGGYG